MLLLPGSRRLSGVTTRKNDPGSQPGDLPRGFLLGYLRLTSKYTRKAKCSIWPETDVQTVFCRRFLLGLVGQP